MSAAPITSIQRGHGDQPPPLPKGLTLVTITPDFFEQQQEAQMPTGDLENGPDYTACLLSMLSPGDTFITAYRLKHHLEPSSYCGGYLSVPHLLILAAQNGFLIAREKRTGQYCIGVEGECWHSVAGPEVCAPIGPVMESMKVFNPPRQKRKPHRRR